MGVALARDQASQEFDWHLSWQLSLGESSRGNGNRGNRPERFWEGNLPLRGHLRGRVFRGFQKILEVFRGLQRPFQTPFQRQISLSEALGPVAPSRVAPWNSYKSQQILPVASPNRSSKICAKELYVELIAQSPQARARAWPVCRNQSVTFFLTTLIFHSLVFGKDQGKHVLPFLDCLDFLGWFLARNFLAKMGAFFFFQGFYFLCIRQRKKILGKAWGFPWWKQNNQGKEGRGG